VEVLDDPGAMRAWSDEQRRRGGRLALVPTMGALHDGHLSLIERATGEAGLVVVSIFVNPLQFDRHADFDRYPRPIDQDVDRCARAGVDAVYAPTAAAMYPDGFETHVEPGPLADVMEGAMRPGHFRGVLTVVTKLFAAVGPQVAMFGEKDFQQLTVIRRMARDLDLGVEVVGAPIVREPDGLAISSRNALLSEDDRAAAVCIPTGLSAAIEACRTGEREASAIVDVARRVVEAEPRARLEYAEVFDPVTLHPVDEVSAEARIAIAAWLGGVRLIDNGPLYSPAHDAHRSTR